MAAESGTYVRAKSLLGLEECVAAAGHDLRPLVERVGLPLSALTNFDRYISCRKFNLLIETAANEFDMPNLGLAWTLRIPDHYPNLGPVLMLAYFSRNARDWLEKGIEYWCLHTDGVTYKLLDEPGAEHSVIRYCPDGLATFSRHLVEHSLASLVGVARRGTGRSEENPSLIRFRHRQPKDIALHKAIFRCPIEFEAEFNEIIFDSEFMEFSTIGSLQLFGPLLHRYIQSRIDRMDIYDGSTATTVALAISSIIGTNATSMNSVAELLDIHPKTLQRSLANEGTNFSDVLDKVRANLASGLLVNSSMPMAKIAKLLDYSGSAPFTLAFRRWEEISPRNFRKLHTTAQ